jgi:predicted esterase
VLCGGLIGGDDGELARPAAGELDGLPVLLTGIEDDAWVPVERVRRTADRLRAAGARVDERVHPPAPHGIQPEDVAALRAIVGRLVA